MLNLPNITLIAMSGIGHKAEQNAHALIESQKDITYGAVKYIQLGEIKDIDSWNKAIIYELPKYIETDFALLVHGDGYVLNADLWNPEWLNYDYVGAPWPIPSPTDMVSYRDKNGLLRRVGNSVSLRSKRLLNLTTTREWKSYYGFTNEDGFICCHNAVWLEEQGCKFAPLEVAKHFSKEHDILENANLRTFAFHSL